MCYLSCKRGRKRIYIYACSFLQRKHREAKLDSNEIGYLQKVGGNRMEKMGDEDRVEAIERYSSVPI